MASNVTWFGHLSALLSGTLPKDNEEMFKEAVGSIVNYVQLKSCGRCLSKQLFDQEKLEAMTHKLFTDYSKGLTSSELCREKLMRKLIKRDRANEDSLNFLDTRIVPHQISLMPNKEGLLRDPAILYWLREFDATIIDPATLQEQQKTLGGMSEEYQNKLTEGRKVIGKELSQSVAKGWIDADKIGMIIATIEKEGPHSENAPELTEESAVSYFSFRYRELIQSGKEYAADFRKSLVTGLSNYKKDPTVTKKAFPQ